MEFSILSKEMKEILRFIACVLSIICAVCYGLQFLFIFLRFPPYLQGVWGCFHIGDYNCLTDSWHIGYDILFFWYFFTILLVLFSFKKPRLGGIFLVLSFILFLVNVFISGIYLNLRFTSYLFFLPLFFAGVCFYLSAEKSKEKTL